VHFSAGTHTGTIVQSHTSAIALCVSTDLDAKAERETTGKHDFRKETPCFNQIHIYMTHM
jgi:hypothetical protein